MSHTIDTVELKVTSPGAQRALKVHRIGQEGGRPRAYLQASLHANETPGMLILHHLLVLLLEADRDGSILGEVVLTPYANPIGLGENVLGTQIGRTAIDGGGNFNRGFPDLAPAVIDRVEGQLGQDAAGNVAIIRAALKEETIGLQARTEREELQHRLLGLSIDADIVLDIHCDEEALFYLVLAPWLWPAARDLVADSAADATFLADSPPLFDTACSRPWHDLSQHFAGSHPVPLACLSATLEMRGSADVSDNQAREDALRIFRFLQRRGVLGGDPGPLPDPRCEPTPFGGVEFVRAPSAGIVTYRQPLGTRVAAGDVVAEVIDPDADDPDAARTPVRCTGGGLFVMRRLNKLVRPDDTVCKVAGEVLLEEPNHY